LVEAETRPLLTQGADGSADQGLATIFSATADVAGQQVAAGGAPVRVGVGPQAGTQAVILVSVDNRGPGRGHSCPSAVLAGISPRYAGATSGALTAAIQVGNVVGVAIIGIIFCGSLGAAERTASPYPKAFGAGLIYLICVAFAVAILIQLLPRQPTRSNGRK
jgi:hypothetical protein